MSNKVPIEKGGEYGAFHLDAAGTATTPAGVPYELIVPEDSVTFSAIASNWSGTAMTGQPFTKPLGGVFRNITVSDGRAVAYRQKP